MVLGYRAKNESAKIVRNEKCEAGNEEEELGSVEL
jgi:hypothetical protein